MTQEPTTLALDATGTTDSAARSAMTTSVKAYVCLAVAHAMVDCFSTTWAMFKTLAGLDLARAGLLASIGFFIASLLQPVIGAVADHGHRRRLVLLGCCFVSLNALLGPLSMTGDFIHSPAGYAAMFGVLMLSWLGGAMFHPPAVSLAGATISGRRSTGVALFIACGMTGMASSHFLFSFVFRQMGRHTEILMIPAALVVVWVWRWCRVPQARREGQMGPRLLVARIAQLPARLIPLWIIQVCVSSHQQGMVFLMPEFAADRGYGNVFIYGGAYAAMIGGSVVMMVPVGHLADRIGRRRVMMLCLMLVLPLHLLLVLTPNLPPLLCLPMLFLVGGLAGASGPVGISHGQALAPQHASLITGFLLGFAWAAAGPTSWIVGTLAKRPSLGPGGALAWLTVVLVVACVLVWFVPRGGAKQSKSMGD